MKKRSKLKDWISDTWFGWKCRYKRFRNLMPHVTIKTDGRLVFSEEARRALDLTKDSGIVLFVSDTDPTDLAISASTKTDPKAYAVAGGKDGKPLFVRISNYLDSNNVPYPKEDLDCECIDLEYSVDGHRIYRICLAKK
jgi:hypothetical protein